MLYKKLK